MDASLATIRQETPEDFPGVRAVHLAAFPTSAEADLVDQLRLDGDAVFSLVALQSDSIRGSVIGHAMFSRMRAPFAALGLAPVAVAAGYRRQGVADALIRYGLSKAKKDGYSAVFVLGDPEYYGRFGFDADGAAQVDGPYPPPHFMARLFDPLVRSEPKPKVQYPAAFDAL